MSSFPAPEMRTLVREYIARELRQYLQAERIISGAGIIVKQTVAGKTLSVASSARSSPYRVHGVNGTQATVTGSYSTTTPYLWINVANNTSEWKAITGAWPPDTVILDGRMANCPEEFWVLR